MGASPQGFESLRFRQIAAVAQVVEHILGKDEVTSSSLVSSSKAVFHFFETLFFFIFLLPVGDKNIKARFLLKTVRSCWRHRTTIENTSCSHRLCSSSSAVKRIDFIELLAPTLLQIKILRAFLCIRLSSSAAGNHSIVKKMFWVAAVFLYSCCPWATRI